MKDFAAALLILVSSSNALADGVVYSTLSQRQKELFEGFVQARDRGARVSYDYAMFAWYGLDAAEKTTYTAVTHALENTKLGLVGTALDQVVRVTAIQGDLHNDGPVDPFTIGLEWSPVAVRTFLKSGFMPRTDWGHEGEWSLTYLAMPVGLHLLFSTTGGSEGHVHVDYRHIGQGHFEQYNPDIRQVGPERDTTGRVIDNYLRHVSWFGPIAGYHR